MSYTKEQIEQLWKESAKRERDLVAEYKKTHYVPSRATISTPEIEEERAEQKRLYGEYLKVLEQNE